MGWHAGRWWGLASRFLALSVCFPISSGQFAGYSQTPQHKPLALHQLIVVEPGGAAVIALRGYDLDGDALKAEVTFFPDTGSVHQLSKVFSDYGYEPKQGPLMARGTEVTGSGNRVYYKRPVADAAPAGVYGVMGYRVMDSAAGNTAKATSHEGLVTFVPPSGILVGSHFTRGSEDWTITGSKIGEHPVTYESSSRGVLNHYVYGSDDTINTHHATGSDQSLWYFKAPSKFLGHHGISYRGKLQFTLSSFQGDYSSDRLNTGALVAGGLHLVYLECGKCNLNKGVRLAFPLSATKSGFSGTATMFDIELSETGGWLEDSKNSLVKWSPPSQCTFIEVLSGLSGVSILGDITKWYESVALDTVQVVNHGAKIPVCAQGTPDASACTC